ncbi:hypothetical protein [Epilithonimonas tenax]|uniref:hypothetical protein n=1 Tax=Epilithonimonas tenax TaxID=191577 RepID=UPI0003FE6B07|nr:hypothetical protein [Epilithonimonas tenax]
MSENPSTSLSSGSTTGGKAGISIFKKQFRQSQIAALKNTTLIQQKKPFQKFETVYILNKWY